MNYWNYSTKTDRRECETLRQHLGCGDFSTTLEYLMCAHGENLFSKAALKSPQSKRQANYAWPFCLLSCILVLLFAGRSLAQDTNVPRTVLLDPSVLQANRERLREGDKSLQPALDALKRDAKEDLDIAPFSVMDKVKNPPSGDKHDYLSLAPYFWPNPDTPNGLPYVRHDGKRNPANRTPDRSKLGRLCDAVQTLGLAYYFTGDEAYAKKATSLLQTWFLDPGSRMNPNFQYAQGIPGITTGRGTGLIESVGFTHLLDGVDLLAGSKAWTDADQRGIQDWFTQFLDWMQNSKNGRAEAAARNNHGTYYDLQVVCFARFVGRDALATNVLEAVKTKRIARQIKPDGEQPLETARADSWGYSVMNLRGLMTLARVGKKHGVNLWDYQTPDGRSIRKAFDFLLPFALGQKKWPFHEDRKLARREFRPLIREAAEVWPGGTYSKLAAQLPAVPASDRSVLLLSANSPTGHSARHD